MANIFDARNIRENLRHQNKINEIDSQINLTSAVEGLVKQGLDIAGKVGQQIGSQQAQDWTEQYDKDYTEAMESGSLFKDKDGNYITDEAALQQRVDEWTEQYKIDNPQPKNMWAQQALDSAEKAASQQRREKTVNSLINNYLSQAQDNLNTKVNNIISTSYSNPSQTAQEVVASYGLDYSQLTPSEQQYYTESTTKYEEGDERFGKGEIPAKKLALSLAYRTAGYNDFKTEYSVQGATPAIEDNFVANNYVSTYKEMVLDNNKMSDNEFNTNMDKELKASYTKNGYVQQDRIDGIKSVVSARNKIARDEAVTANSDAYNRYVVPAIQSMYANSKNTDNIQYPNTQTVTSLMNQYGINYVLLDDKTKSNLETVMESGDKITTLTNAVHEMNSISSSNMPDDMKHKEMTSYLSTLPPDQVKQIQELADLDPFRGKFSQFTDKDIYEYVTGLSSPQLIKSNISDEYVDTDLSAANVARQIENYFAFGAGEESVLFLDLLSATRNQIEEDTGISSEDEKKALRNEVRLGEQESEEDATESYYETKDSIVEDIVDERFSELAQKAYSDAKDFIARYGDTKLDEFNGKTLNDVLAGKQALYTNRLKATTNFGADGRLYYPESGISTNGLLDSDKAQIERENIRIDVGTGLVFSKLLSETSQDQREAILNDVYAHSNEYKESDVKVMEQLVRGDASEYLKKNGISLSSYTSLLGSNDNKAMNTVKQQINASIAREIPKHYVNGVFNRTGFDAEAKKITTRFMSAYAQGAYFDTSDMSLDKKDSERMSSLIQLVRNPNKTATIEAENFVNEIISDAAQGEMSDNFTWLMANSLNVKTHEGTTFSKLLTDATLTKGGQLTTKDRVGLALGAVMEKLGFISVHTYGKGNEKEYFSEVYSQLNELSAYERNFIIDCAGKLNDISEQASELRKLGYDFSTKSHFDTSFYSSDMNTKFTPVYDSNGTLSFNVETLKKIPETGNEEYVSLGNSAVTTINSLSKFSKQLTKDIHYEIDSALRQSLDIADKQFGIGNNIEVKNARKVEYDKAGDEGYIYEKAINMLTNGSEYATEFDKINTVYKATHDGIGLKPVIVMKNNRAYQDNYGYNFTIEFVEDSGRTTQYTPKKEAK